jgi:hypothetical protein
MKTLRTLTLLLSTVVLVLAVAMGPAAAVEGGGGGGEDGPTKIELPDRPRDQVGLVLLGLLVGGGLLAFVNARKQLRGERKQASGEFRWR